jgi:Tfp pilus assembly protein PilO
MTSRSAWVRLWWVWLAPALLLVVNLIWLLGIRSALGRGPQLARQRDAGAARVAALTTQRDALAGSRAALTVLESDLGSMRKERLGSMRERLVAFLVDINKRTSAAGLRPDRISYAVEADKKSGLVRFSAVFSVSGTYEEVRRCVNLLEGSPQFVVVERLVVRSEDGIDSLAVDIQLTVSTYFVDADTGMLRQLGIEDLPRTAATGAAPGGAPVTAAATEAAVAAPAVPPTDFTAVDARVLEDLRAAAAGLADGEAEADADVFMQPAAEPTSRRDRGRAANDQRSRSGAFMTQTGRREVSGGR